MSASFVTIGGVEVSLQPDTRPPHAVAVTSSGRLSVTQQPQCRGDLWRLAGMVLLVGLIVAVITVIIERQSHSHKTVRA